MVIVDGERREAMAEAARQRVGTILNGKWRLDSLLGIGGMAAVFAATHRNGHRVAIKLLHPHFSQDQSLRARLQQEGYVANSIDHPGALRILDDDRAEDGTVFLIMELLAGEGLDARLKRKGWRLPQNEALAITGSVLEVLAAAHAKGIVHRDIKPDNVFITRTGEVKVLDFGIARMRTAMPSFPEGISRSHNGALFGTLGFMAPEQALARSHEIDGRTDLWATGAMLFTVLSGRLVHEAPTPNEQLVNAATRRAPPFSSVVPEANPPLAAFIDRALAFERDERWPSAGAMLEALDRLAQAGPEGRRLQVPRVSVEIDLPPLLVRGWPSSQRRGDTGPSGEYSVPAIPTSLLRRPRRVARGAVMAGVAALVLAAGTGWRHYRERLAGGGFTAPGTATAAGAPAGPGAEPTATTVAPVAPTAVDASVVEAPMGRVLADGPRPAEPRPKAGGAARRSARLRAVRGPGRRGPPRTGAAAGSVVRDDILWGRRH